MERLDNFTVVALVITMACATNAGWSITLDHLSDISSFMIEMRAEFAPKAVPTSETYLIETGIRHD